MIPPSIGTLLGSFLFAFPALFSIVNPIGSALIFNSVVAGRPAADRHRLARSITLYAAAILLGSLWLGAFVLSFFGISLGALRIAGGLVLAISAWDLLMQPGQHPDKQMEHGDATGSDVDDIAFFPLTMPLTTGPGTIAVAIALSSQRPTSGSVAPFFSGMSLAALAIAVLVLLAYRWSDRVVVLLGAGGSRVVTRLMSFLLLCVGIQIIVTGVASLAPMLRAALSS